MSHEELNDKFGVQASFLNILQLRSAIPCAWKRRISDTATQNSFRSPSISTSEGTSVNILKETSKQFYNVVVQFSKPLISSQMKWNDVFPIGEDSQQLYWEEIYRRPYTAARDTKLQAFQYRLCHRIIPCNKFLKNIRIRQDHKCSFCQEQRLNPAFSVPLPIYQGFLAQSVCLARNESGPTNSYVAPILPIWCRSYKTSGPHRQLLAALLQIFCKQTKALPPRTVLPPALSPRAPI